MVYGDKFKSLLIENDNTKFYSEKNIINVGIRKYLDTGIKLPKTSKKILFTLQITADFHEKQFNEQYVQIVKKLIEDNAQFLTLHNYEIIFRHHPRYSITQCPELKIENDFVSFDNKTPILDLLSDVNVHITFNSSSSLDAAMIGIPTIFIDMHNPQSPNEIFFNQYKYPLKDLVIKDYEDLKKLLTGFQDKDTYDSYCKSVHDWSDELYQDFDESKFKNFLLETINFDNNT